MTTWSPYVVGAGIGLLACVTFVLSNKPLGCSTSFARTAGMIERVFRGDRVLARPYYREYVPEIDWQWMLVAGILLGAYVSATTSGDFVASWTSDRWVCAFGETPVLRVIVALFGGVVMGFGARWAGGCTSGHGISGTLQLSVASWVATAAFFVGGIVTAMLIFRVFAG